MNALTVILSLNPGMRDSSHLSDSAVKLTMFLHYNDTDIWFIKRAFSLLGYSKFYDHLFISQETKQIISYNYRII